MPDFLASALCNAREVESCQYFPNDTASPANALSGPFGVYQCSSCGDFPRFALAKTILRLMMLRVEP